jgi:hypothetical protein
MRVISSAYSRRTGWSSPLATDCDGPQTVVFAFGAASYRDQAEPWADLRAAFPNAALLGCSTAGEIHDTTVEDESLSVVAVTLERSRLKLAQVSLGQTDSFESGVALGRQLVAPDLRAVILLCDGLNVNGTQLTNGLSSVLGDVPTSGGLAGDGTRFQSTWVLASGRPSSGAACAVGLYGSELHVGHGCKGGWDKFGPERRVTRADGNVLFELDDRPALDVYERYLGDLATGLPATALLYPIAIRKDRTSEEQLVRTILRHSPQDRSLTFAGDMPTGALAQLMRANLDRLIQAAQEAGVASTGTTHASFCLAVSCVGRRLVLGARVEEELLAVREALPADCVLAGFYSYGEISPRDGRGGQLHNQTMTVTTFAEAPCTPSSNGS